MTCGKLYLRERASAHLEPNPPHIHRLVDNLVNRTRSQTVFFNATQTSKWQKQDENFPYILLFYDENFSVALWLCAYKEVLPDANRRLPSGRVAVWKQPTVGGMNFHTLQW